MYRYTSSRWSGTMARFGDTGKITVLAGSVAIALSASMTISVASETITNIEPDQGVRERLAFFHSAVKAGDIVPLNKDGKKADKDLQFSGSFNNQKFNKN
jgi:hypothetical protein